MAMLPRLHLVSDDATVRSPDFFRHAVSLMQAGGPRLAFHLRAPRAGGRALWEVARRLCAEARGSGALLLVNDRIDVALAVGADGAQCGARSLPAADARALLGAERLLGVSVHDAAGAVAAARARADFVLAGTLYETASHPGRVGAGVGWLSSAASVGLPVIGIGGISVERVTEVRAAGGWGVAVLRGIWEAARPVAALESFIQALYQRDGRD